MTSDSGQKFERSLPTCKKSIKLFL